MQRGHEIKEFFRHSSMVQAAQRSLVEALCNEDMRSPAGLGAEARDECRRLASEIRGWVLPVGVVGRSSWEPIVATLDELAALASRARHVARPPVQQVAAVEERIRAFRGFMQVAIP